MTAPASGPESGSAAAHGLTARPATLDDVRLGAGPGLADVATALERRHFLAAVTGDLAACDVAITTDPATAAGLERAGVPCVVVTDRGTAAEVDGMALVTAARDDLRAIERGLCADPAYGAGPGGSDERPGDANGVTCAC